MFDKYNIVIIRKMIIVTLSFPIMTMTLMFPCRLISYMSMIYRSIEYGDWVFAVEFGILHVRQNAITHSQYWRSAASRDAGVFFSFLRVDFQCTCFTSFHLPNWFVVIEQMIICIKRVTSDLCSVWCRKIIRELLSSYSCEQILYSLLSRIFFRISFRDHC